MGKGRQKMKAKIAGAFVAFRGFISLVLIGLSSLGGVQLGAGFLISFAISLGTFFSGLGVLAGVTKAYFLAGILTMVHLVFFAGSILGIALDVAVIGALIAGYSIQERENVGGVNKY